MNFIFLSYVPELSRIYDRNEFWRYLEPERIVILMGRKHIENYTGATGRITRSNLVKLTDAFVVQPKMDGVYCHVHLDRVGCIARISSRTGGEYKGEQVSGLIGQFVGWPGAVFVGELTAHTEAGVRDFESFGARRVHVFDLVYGYNTIPVHHLAQHERRRLLEQMQSQVRERSGIGTQHESEHGLRDNKTGWFATRRHNGLDLTPLVAEYAPGHTGELWAQVDAGELEGLVAVSKRAKVGARGSKRKCKQTDTLDVVVLSVDARTVLALAGATMFTINRGSRDIRKGDVIEVKHDGYYRAGTPRFPRITKVRFDKML